MLRHSYSYLDSYLCLHFYSYPQHTWRGAALRSHAAPQAAERGGAGRGGVARRRRTGGLNAETAYTADFPRPAPPRRNPTPRRRRRRHPRCCVHL